MLPSLRFQESQIAGNKAAVKTDIGQQVSQDTQQILKDYLNKLRRKPSELMPCTASRCYRYQLVERLGALHLSIPDAVELIEISGSLTTLHSPEGKRRSASFDFATLKCQCAGQRAPGNRDLTRCVPSHPCGGYT